MSPRALVCWSLVVFSATSCGGSEDWADVEAPAEAGAALCGDGVVSAGEQCDGPLMAGQTCASVSMGIMSNGTLRCTQCTFDTRSCRSGTGGSDGTGGNGSGGMGTGGSGTGGFGNGGFGNGGFGTGGLGTGGFGNGGRGGRGNGRGNGGRTGTGGFGTGGATG